MTFWKNKQILILGGAGFIGSHLVKTLLEKDANICVFDNLQRGKQENLKDVMDKIAFFSIRDLRSPTYLPKADIVFDCAAKISGIWNLYTNESAFIRDNTLILLNNLESLKEKIEYYIWFSSSCVYNYKGCPIPHKEEDANQIPKTGYDISKRLGEEIIRLYAKQYGFKHLIIRPFNVYGLQESEESPHVITDFWNRIIQEKKKPTGKFWILGSGKQIRSFTYIKDFIDATIFLTEKEIEGTYNVGTGEARNIRNLLDIMLFTADLPFLEYNIEHRESFKQDVQKRCPDVSKLLSLGWKPKYNLEQGLKEMWNQLKSE